MMTSIARITKMATIYPLSLKVSGDSIPSTKQTISRKAKMNVNDIRKASRSFEYFRISIRAKDKIIMPLVKQILKVEYDDTRIPMRTLSRSKIPPMKILKCFMMDY